MIWPMVYTGNRNLIKNARELRRNMTLPEIPLWSKLRSKQLDGYKFRRQQPIFDYVVDFYCHELKLIIEVDGEIHSRKEQLDFDENRDKILKINGYYIFRLSNFEIQTDLETSVNKLRSYISTNLSPSMGTTGGLQNE
jgi:very-short-patch-repair endonuclease